MARNRLEFEPDLIAEITASTPRRGGSSRGVWLLTFPVVVLLAAAIVLIGAVTEPGIGFLLFARTNPSLIAMSHNMVEAMQSPDPASVMNLFSPSNTQSATGTRRHQLLADMRDDLESQGLRWENVQPRSLIGVSARARNDETGVRNAQVFTGEVILESNGALFSIEVSARRENRRFYLVDIWHWDRLSETDLAAYASRQFYQFESDPGDPESGIRLSRVRQVNLTL